MKLRFYLRGLGIGIIFSAVICSFGKTSAQEPMTDSEIIARAKELGMVEGTVLSQQPEIDAAYSASLNENGELVLESNTAIEETNMTSDPEETIETETEETTVLETVESDSLPETEIEETTESIEESPEETVAEPETVENVTGETEESAVPDIEETKQEIAESEPTIENDNNPSGEIVTITVKKGSGSYTVAQSCESAGLVQSARDFDDFLCKNGYANRISVGSFEITTGSDYETIAKILTHSK